MDLVAVEYSVRIVVEETGPIQHPGGPPGWVGPYFPESRVFIGLPGRLVASAK